ncbi:MAG: hypothetical protein AAGN35_11790 [Bacteroidota bacterium]
MALLINNIQATSPPASSHRAVAHAVVQRSPRATSRLPERAVEAGSHLQQLLHNSSRTHQLRQWQQLADRSPQVRRAAGRTQLVRIQKSAPFSRNRTPRVMQRLVVHTGHGSLLDDVNRDAGWITSSTLQVALNHGPNGQDIIELSQLGGYGGLGQNENIYLVGHGRADNIGVQDPRDLADAVRPRLPQGYRGNIISLNCSSGQGVENSAIHAFTDRINLLGIVVDGPRGPSLHHPNIPEQVRVIKPHHTNKVRNQIIATQDATQQAWINQRNEIVAGNNYQNANNAGKIRMLSTASVDLSRDFYRNLVTWCNAQNYLYGVNESHTRSEVVRV